MSELISYKNSQFCKLQTLGKLNLLICKNYMSSTTLGWNKESIMKLRVFVCLIWGSSTFENNSFELAAQTEKNIVGMKFQSFCSVQLWSMRWEVFAKESNCFGLFETQSFTNSSSSHIGIGYSHIPLSM